MFNIEFSRNSPFILMEHLAVEQLQASVKSSLLIWAPYNRKSVCLVCVKNHSEGKLLANGLQLLAFANTTCRPLPTPPLSLSPHPTSPPPSLSSLHWAPSVPFTKFHLTNDPKASHPSATPSLPRSPFSISVPLTNLDIFIPLHHLPLPPCVSLFTHRESFLSG